MKKRKSMGVWGLLILLCVCFCGTAFAAAPALTFALQTDGAELSGGGYVLTGASPGDTLTVRFSVLRTDADESFALFTIQNEIEFDMDFFEFVEGSAVKLYQNADVMLQTRVRGQEIIKTAALGGPEYEPEQAFCEFQLKIKDTATGSGVVQCSNTAATDSDHSTVTIGEQNLTVTVSASGGSSGGSSSSGSSGGSSGSSGGSSGGSSSGSSSGSSGSGSSGGSSSSSGSGSSGGSSSSSGSSGSSSGSVNSGETGQIANETTPVQTGENSSSDTASSDSTGSDTDSVANPDSVSVAKADVAQCPKDTSCPLAAFSDLDPSAWYHDGVHFCVEQGIMNGYSDGTFGPQKIVSRAQLAMILWNREGNPDANTELNFQDVDSNGWYAGAIRWALGGKILTGYNADFFGPNDILTRQQLATILYRYSGSPAQSDAAEKLSGFEDAAQIGSYARDAMAWAVSAGLIQGTTSVTLNPAGSATRAQTAVIMMRFLTNEKEGA